MCSFGWYRVPLCFSCPHAPGISRIYETCEMAIQTGAPWDKGEGRFCMLRRSDSSKYIDASNRTLRTPQTDDLPTFFKYIQPKPDLDSEPTLIIGSRLDKVSIRYRHLAIWRLRCLTALREEIALCSEETCILVTDRYRRCRFRNCDGPFPASEQFNPSFIGRRTCLCLVLEGTQSSKS